MGRNQKRHTAVLICPKNKFVSVFLFVVFRGLSEIISVTRKIPPKTRGCRPEREDLACA